MKDLQGLVAALAAAGPEAKVRLRQAVVQNLNADGTVDLTIAGGSTVVTGVQVAASCCPIYGGSVWVAVDGRDMFVLATLTPSAPAFGTMRKSTTQSIANDTWTAVSYSSRTDVKSNGGFVVGSSGFLVVTPGIYSVTANATFDNNATGNRGARIVLNSTPTIGQGTFPAPSGSQYARVQLAATIICANGDLIGVECYQNSGAALNLLAANGLNGLAAVWVGPPF